MKRFLICFLVGIIGASPCFSKGVNQEEKISPTPKPYTLENVKALNAIRTKTFLDIELTGIKENNFIRDEK